MMRPWTDAMVREALGLRVELADAELHFTGVSTDSRSVTEGDLYVALVGDRFDGHDFVAAAIDAGARGVLVSDDIDVDDDIVIIEVDDTLEALQRLARSVRAQHPGIVVETTSRDESGPGASS